MAVIESGEPFKLPEALDWHCDKFAPGVRGPFMLGAPPIGLYCHHPVRRTVPCLTLLKGCTLTCPWCRFRKQWTTYLPVLALNEVKRWRVIFTGGKRTWEDAKKFQVGELLGVTRGNHDKDTIRLAPWPEAVNPSQLTFWRKRCQEEIGPYLLHLWQYRPLTEHLGQRYYKSLRVMANETSAPQLTQDEDGAPIVD